MPGYMVKPLSGRLIGMNDLSAADVERIHLRGLTETWESNVWKLCDLARALWDKIGAKNWKVVEAGTSFNNTSPYGGNNGMSSSL